MHRRITIEGSTTIISELVIDDPAVADLLRDLPDGERAEMVARAIAVGSRGLATMGLGIDVAEVDARVRRSVEDALTTAQGVIGATIEQADRSLGATFDPASRNSVIGQTLEAFGSWRSDFLAGLDPDHLGSHTRRFIDQLGDLLGPDGEVERRLRAALDPTDDTSGLARLRSDIERQLGEIRDLILREQGRSDEAVRGTQKGLEYEDRLEEAIRAAVPKGGGWIVERTSRIPGSLSAESMVGDLVVTDAGGHRIVIEAKDTARLSVSGRDGVLAELDRAMANREAVFAICVSARDAFSADVGSFGVFGNRVLVVDDGEGTMVRAALRWARADLAARAQAGAAIDRSLILDRLQRVRDLAQSFSSAKRSLTDIRTSVENVRDSLDRMRQDLLESVTDLDRAFSDPADRPPSAVVELTSKSA